MTSTIEPTSAQAAQRAVAELREHAAEWANWSVEEKVVMLRELVSRADDQAAWWVETAAKGKQLEPGSVWVAEEWVSGPWAFIEWCQAAIETLNAIREGQLPHWPPVRASSRGIAIVRVFPASRWDAILLNGVSAEVHMQEGVTPQNLGDHVGAFYAQEDPPGTVAVVLGAGNITSIAVLDSIYRLFVMGHVVMLKMNPVNEWMGPVFESILEPLVARGWLRFAYGGAEIGKLLTTHELVDEIHLTGSEHTYDAIVFGVGPEGQRRKASNEPLNTKPVTAELGGVGPSIVVPGGAWTAQDIRFQAENIVTQKLHNSGHNCVAAQVLVVPDEWALTDELLDAIEAVMRELPPRAAWYPGADTRQSDAAARHTDHVLIPNGDVPRTILCNVPADEDHFAFQEEFFGVVLAVTRLPGATPAEFWSNAVAFANDRLRGTLGATVTIHPSVRGDLGEAFDRGIEELRYGAIGVNIWNAAAYLLARGAWGAYPGHQPTDIQSGVGTVHNAFMFDKPAKTVVTGPFAPMPRAWKTGDFHLAPKPLWFVTNKTAHITARRVTHFAARPSFAGLPGIFAAALRG